MFQLEIKVNKIILQLILSLIISTGTHKSFVYTHVYILNLIENVWSFLVCCYLKGMIYLIYVKLILCVVHRKNNIYKCLSHFLALSLHYLVRSYWECWISEHYFYLYSSSLITKDRAKYIEILLFTLWYRALIIKNLCIWNLYKQMSWSQ